MNVKIGTAPFDQRVHEGIQNDFMRKAVSSAQSRFRSRKHHVAEELGNWEDWRTLGEEIRKHTLENLDYYLQRLSEEVSRRGGHVFFAQTAHEANEYIQKIVKEKNAKKIVKSKSMVTEEIGLNHVLAETGAEVIETDLGEWILQLDEDPPSHIVVPALHKDRVQIKKTFMKKEVMKEQIILKS